MKSVDIANQVFNPRGINFLFDPATDTYRFNDDLLNRDCQRRDHQLYIDKNVDPANDPLLEGDTYNKRRNEVALRFPGRSQSTSPREAATGGTTARDAGWSNHFDEFVTMASWAAGNDVVAHEIGHYLHLPHTFGATPATLDEAVALIRRFVEADQGSPDAVPGLFDGDGVADTPPDPGPTLFKRTSVIRPRVR